MTTTLIWENLLVRGIILSITSLLTETGWYFLIPFEFYIYLNINMCAECVFRCYRHIKNAKRLSSRAQVFREPTLNACFSESLKFWVGWIILHSSYYIQAKICFDNPLMNSHWLLYYLVTLLFHPDVTAQRNYRLKCKRPFGPPYIKSSFKIIYGCGFKTK